MSFLPYAGASRTAVTASFSGSLIMHGGLFSLVLIGLVPLQSLTTSLSDRNSGGIQVEIIDLSTTLIIEPGSVDDDAGAAPDASAGQGPQSADEVAPEDPAAAVLEDLGITDDAAQVPDDSVALAPSDGAEAGAAAGPAPSAELPAPPPEAPAVPEDAVETAPESLPTIAPAEPAQDAPEPEVLGSAALPDETAQTAGDDDDSGGFELAGDDGSTPEIPAGAELAPDTNAGGILPNQTGAQLSIATGADTDDPTSIEGAGNAPAEEGIAVLDPTISGTTPSGDGGIAPSSGPATFAEPQPEPILPTIISDPDDGAGAQQTSGTEGATDTEVQAPPVTVQPSTDPVLQEEPEIPPTTDTPAVAPIDLPLFGTPSAGAQGAEPEAPATGDEELALLAPAPAPTLPLFGVPSEPAPQGGQTGSGILAPAPTPATPETLLPRIEGGGAEGAPRPSGQELVENPSQQMLDIAALIRAIRAAPETGCALALPRMVGTTGTAVSIIGTEESSTLASTRLVLDQPRAEARNQVREIIDAQQCAALDALRLIPSYPAGRIGISMDTSLLASGEEILAEVVGAGGLIIELLLVDDNGVVQDLRDFATLDGDVVTLRVPVARAGATRDTRQMLLVLGTANGGLIQPQMYGRLAEQVFPAIPRALLLGAEFGAISFQLR